MKTKIIFNYLIAICLIMCASQFASAQTKEVIGEKVQKSRGESKYQRPTADVPAEKPNKARGTCCIDFDNFTGYYIDVWVDDVYRGRVAPWDKDGICVYSGWTSWYAETAGGTYYWNGEGECYGDYTLSLRN